MRICDSILSYYGVVENLILPGMRDSALCALSLRHARFDASTCAPHRSAGPLTAVRWSSSGKRTPTKADALLLAGDSVPIPNFSFGLWL